MFLVQGVVVLAAGLMMLWLGGPAMVRATVATALAVVLLTAAGLVSRAVRDPQTGTLLAVAAAAYAATAGWLGAEAIAPHSAPAVRIALASLAALVTLAAGLSAVADSGLIFVGALTFAAGVAVPALLAAAGPVTQQEAAACGLVLSMVVTLMLPPAAFRLGGLALPLLPGKPDQLSDNIDPEPYRVVVDRGTAGLSYLAALSIGVGTAQTLLGAALVFPGRTWPMILALVAAALLSMRARHLTAMVARWAMMVPAAALVVFVLIRYATDQEDLVRAAVLAPAVAAIAGALLAAAATLPGRRLRPYWGRAVDILEIVIAVSLIPVLGGVLEVYQAVRAWAS